MQRTSPVKPEQYNKYKRQGGNDLAVFLCRSVREGFQAKDDVEVKGKCEEGHNQHETHAVASSYL
jgi:hypothetical protein